MQPGPQVRGTLTASIAARVAQCAEGLLTSYGPAGSKRSRNWGDLWNRAAGIAAALHGHGVVPGRPVVLLLADVLDFVPAFWGCLRAGGIAVPLTGAAMEILPERRMAGLRDALARLDRPVILADASFGALAAQLADPETPAMALDDIADTPRAWDDQPPAAPACLVQTSGATGHAKLVALGQHALLNRQFSVGRIAVTQPVSVLSGFPFHSISGLRVAFLCYRDWVQLPPVHLAAAPLALLEAVEQCGVNRVFIGNGQAGDILAAAETSPRTYNLAGLRQVDFGGETIVPATMRRFRDLLARHGARDAAIRAGYGTTETGPLVAGQDPLAAGQGAAYAAAPLGGCAAGVALRIAGADDAVLAEGEIGEVQALCPAVLFSGYWGEPPQRNLTADGWWPTGDLGSLSAGALTLHGRVKEVLVAHGKKYSLAAIDAHLQAVLGVGVRAFACAVLWPDAATEKLAVAVVVGTRWRDQTQAIAARIRQAIAGAFGLSPDPLVFATAAQIPLTATGKPRRAALAALLRAGRLGALPRAEGAGLPPPAGPGTAARAEPWPPPARGPIEAAVAAAWGGAIGWDACAANLPFDRAGADSLKILTVIFRLESMLGRRLPFDIISTGMTPRDLAAAIAGLGDWAPVAADTLAAQVPPVAGDADLPDVAAAACAQARRPEATAADVLRAVDTLLVFGYVARGRAMLLAHGPPGEQRTRMLRLYDALAAGQAFLAPGCEGSLDAMVAHVADADRLIVIFPGKGGRFWGLNEPVFLNRTDASIVFLRDTGACLYLDGIPGLGPDYRACLAALRRIRAATGKRLHCIGHSTGGYAALRFGLDLGADSVLAFSCPVNLDVADQPPAELERRHLVELRRRAPGMMVDLRSLYTAAARPPRVLLCYGEDHPQDAAAANQLAGLPGVAQHPIPGYAGHQTLAEAMRLGLLDPLVHDCLGAP